ncbi:MAG: chemotaxis protein CheC [Lachnospiraceae bacterium]|nr:chemotaxis protein CheC [Lachnospiraceae bacterium]MDE6626353.1 chemotaxis protein CheC [Lachnospiraceae bacterium]
MTDNERTNMKLDILREIGNIGAGHATAALSTMLNSNFRMEVPNVKFMDFDEIADRIGGSEALVTAVLTRYTGDLTGMTLFILSVEEAKNLAGTMLSKSYPEDFMDFDYMDKSALKEIGNILMGSYISSIGSLTNLQLRTDPPAICVDMAGAVLSLPISELGRIGDQALIIDSKFLDNGRPINGLLMLVSDEESSDKIFNALGIGSL